MSSRRHAVTTWHLEMRKRAKLQAARAPAELPQILRAEIPVPELNRFLYTYVGSAWHWRDRLPWTLAQWQHWLDRPVVQTWVMYLRGTPAGYVELEKQADDAVEIAYFGVAAPFLGRGLGGHLLSCGIERAWDMGAARVWVHTCSLDHPAALANYRARGMVVFREETEDKELADTLPEPWPGAAGRVPT